MARGYGSGAAAGDSLQRATRPPILESIDRSRTRQRWRFRFWFATTWFALIGGLVAAFALAGKIDPSFLGTWAPFILGGVQVTLLVSVSAIVLAVTFAVLGALGRISANPVLYSVASLYVSLVRGTPLLVQIIFFYQALPQFGLVFDALPTGIFALAFNYGAYLTEIFRAGIEAVPRGQVEAAHALGMTPWATMRRIVLPQAVRIVIPAIGNEFIAMTKDSSLVSVITVQELLWRAQRVGNANFRSFETLLLAATVYWILTIIFSLLQGRLENRMARSDRRI